MSATRQGAIGRALDHFDSGGFERDLARRIALPTVSQEPERLGVLYAYLAGEMRPALAALGYECGVFDNPVSGFGPILLARRSEGEGLPTVLGYGHGDVVRGLEAEWSAGLSPWRLARRGERLHGRGSADNKGQHTIALAAQAAVLAERGRLGFNAAFVIEMSEERGSRGLSEFCLAHRRALAADLLLASDGPRASPARAALVLGSRGILTFDLVVDLRDGGHHAGHWGGVLEDPGVILAHALAGLVDGRGRILVRDWLPKEVPASVRAAVSALAIDGGEGAPAAGADWGEPGLSHAEKVLAWTGFIVLALHSGNPENPVNAVQGTARATCQLRFTVDVDEGALLPALRRHLDERGFASVRIEPVHFRSRPASRTDPDNPWVRLAARSLAMTAGRAPDVVPNLSGGLPSDVFAALGMPTIWVPHSYAGCRQHGPDEHLLAPLAREGLALMAGLYWDLGEAGGPPA
ncbi:MAG: M20/M25/M40 family metallo-hydrolase [Proteobacteria bacterium]|nr:M20/M25/M40 family metallo-hydrolase [Pseudomonadota bacterium]